MGEALLRDSNFAYLQVVSRVDHAISSGFSGHVPDALEAYHYSQRIGGL